MPKKKDEKELDVSCCDPEAEQNEVLRDDPRDEEFLNLLYARQVIQQRGLEIGMMLGRIQERLNQFGDLGVKNLSFEFSNRIFQLLNLVSAMVADGQFLGDNANIWVERLDSPVIIPPYEVEPEGGFEDPDFSEIGEENE